MNNQNCDTCAKKTFPVLNPNDPTEMKAITEEKEFEQEVPIPDPNDPTKVIKGKKKFKKTVPVMSFEKRQNMINGKVTKVPIPKFVDLKPRTYFIRLKLGGEIVQRDFCLDCLKGGNRQAAKIFEKAKELFELLEVLEPKQ